ncbi:MAG: DUF4738 domain-containing protein [Prevotella sp.]|nr:DUF4738 domain-containing protein [Prevotella sp.]
MQPFGFCLFLLCLLLASCNQTKTSKDSATEPQEDKRAKELLQGIWINEDEGDVVFNVKGDTIYYPTSTNMPVAFIIVNDTLILQGNQDVRYAIRRQSPHIFEFENQNGDVVKLTKSTNDEDLLEFEDVQPHAINQGLLIKRDTVIMAHGERYHCYVQVNPTSYKVFKTSYNSEGVSVENVYYDNIINLAVFNGTRRVFSSDFHKNDFRKHIPEDIIKQCILSDMIFSGADASGIHYDAEICIPDSPSSYVVDVVVAYDGKVTFHVEE